MARGLITAGALIASRALGRITKSLAEIGIGFLLRIAAPPPRQV